ncbi:hypothetical protein [Bradyrhizobium sp. AZCC 2289]|uniref:hypothetical protein n=1 Tax=Bradyrhizobium sp. AZCC 2289 TaxID=3117026 RepID=UPI002FF3A84E
MAKARKVSKHKNEASTATLKRDLRSQLKSARSSMTQAKQLATKLGKVERNVGAAIKPIFEKLESFEVRLEAFNERLDAMEQNFLDRVKVVAETIAANMKEIADSGRRPETSSGTMKSAFGALTERGFTGSKLPGSFESKRK